MERRYKDFVDQVIGDTYKRMGMKWPKRYPRKLKKAMKKQGRHDIEHSLARRAWTSHSEELNRFRKIAAEVFGNDIINVAESILQVRLPEKGNG